MRYVALALACEGPTDFAFLGPLLAKHVEILIAQRGSETVEIGSVILVQPRGKFGNSVQGVVREFTDERIFADILFLHTDAGGDAEGAQAFRVEPLTAVLADVGDSPSIVAVVPVRKTEAWMLADPAAIESTLGLGEGTVEVSQRPKNVHSIADPKSELKEIALMVESGSGRRRNVKRKGDRIDRLYSTLAADLRLARLREVPSFLLYEERLTVVLSEKGLIS